MTPGAQQLDGLIDLLVEAVLREIKAEEKATGLARNPAALECDDDDTTRLHQP